MNDSRRDDLTGDLAYLASSLEALSLADIPAHARLIERRDWLIRTIRDYLIPRIGDPTAPLIVVFAGPTGAGKSTLLNSVVGSERSAAGPIRPTTKDPLVLSSESRADRYRQIGGVACDVTTGRAPILEELILVDTPDIDSTSTEHRAMAETMIDNADIVVYVSSALRYSDQVPWEVLRRAHSRGAPVIQVMNRIKGSSRGALADYSLRLHGEGLGSEVVAVQEHHVPRGAQSVPSAAIQELRDRLVAVVEARRAGAANVVRSVLETTLDQAREVIEEAAERLEVTGVATVDVRKLLKVDIDRVGALRERPPGGGLDLRPLVDLGSRRFRTRGMTRRRSPSPTAVSRAVELFDESVIAAIDADLRRQIHAGNLIQGKERSNLLSDLHLAARSAITAWRNDLDTSPPAASSLDPSLVSVILGRSCFEEPEQRLAEVIGLLAPGVDLGLSITEAKKMLIARLAPVYAEAEYRLGSRIAGLTASRRSIDRVKASRWAVIARSAFADA
ncbi:MAG TPA: GTPase [Acidimicrobiia bacterium]|nr:GTPase [Acidimicrobiia bacterium]